MEQKQCNHPETHVHGFTDEDGTQRTERIDVHSCDYVDARNSLLPFAEAKANKQVGWKTPAGTEEERAVWNDAWNRTFFEAMDRLWAARCATARALRHPQQHLVAA